jgi:S1-C subfamily serine protease
MRAVFLFFVGLLIGACAKPLPAAPMPSGPSHVVMARELADETVALVAYNSGEARPYCSGVWVTPDIVLTAHHCVDDLDLGEALDYSVRDDVYAPGTNNRKPVAVSRAARLLSTDPGHDLALLRATNVPPHRVARLADGPIYQGEFAQAMGHSLGLWWTYSSGDVSSVREIEVNDMDLIWIQANVPISPGNSGGGLFNEDGALIGIAHATFASPRAQLLNLFVHRNYIRDFISGGRK